MKEFINLKILRAPLCAFVVIIIIWSILRFSPYPELHQFQSRPNSIRYYDRYGMLLQITPVEDGLRREIPHEIPQHIKDVFVFAEDRRFYWHLGVDNFSIIRAFYQNITRGRRVSGASTITMQLARMISDNNKSARGSAVGRKITEMFNAMRLEARFSKDKILEMYINSLPFGFSTEGVTSASRNFFASDLSMLSPAQLFCLAVIPRRPSLYNPLENPGACASAASVLHTRFADNKRLSQKWPLLKNTDKSDFQFAVSQARRFQYPFELPHFIRLINTGLTASAGEDFFARRGLAGSSSESYNRKSKPVSEVHLTIDLTLQRYLENTIAGNVAMYYSSRITNGSALVIDNETAEILAWVGSADFFNAHAAGQIDGVLALNQPGSSMKPFLYAMALETGFNPSHVIADIQRSFGESEIYLPRNFNNRFNGPILMRPALASSLNIPAVYLLYRLGVRNYTQRLLALGFDSVEHSAEDAGLGLALGNAPVSVLELVRAFSVFPRDGLYLPLVWELAISNEQRTEGSITINNEKRIFSPDTSRIICSFLSDSNARVTAFGAGRNFRTSFPAIFKTGTANQYQNIVALGATMKYSAGVWMGNFTGETVMDKTGSSVPAAIVRNTLNALHGTNMNPPSNFLAPEIWQVKRICAVSGMEPAEACLAVINEFIHPDEDRRTCTWHRIINGRSETIYPAEYQAWFTASVRQGSLDYGSHPLEIVNPRDGFEYLSSRAFGMDEIPVEVIGGSSGILHVTHNGRMFSTGRPFVFYLPRVPGVNVLRVQNGGEEVVISFTVR